MDGKTEVDLAPGQEVAILRIPLPRSSSSASPSAPQSPPPPPPHYYLELSAVALGGSDSSSSRSHPLGLGDEDARDAVLVLPSPPPPLPQAAGTEAEEEEGKAGQVAMGGGMHAELRRLVAAINPLAMSQGGQQQEQQQQAQAQEKEEAGTTIVPSRGVWVTPSPAATITTEAGGVAGADGVWRVHKSLLGAAASLLPAKQQDQGGPSSSSSSTNGGSAVLALPLALYAAHCPRLPRRALAQEAAAFAWLLAAASSSPQQPQPQPTATITGGNKQAGTGGGVRKVVLVAGDVGELKELLHAFHALAATTASEPAAAASCPWGPALQRLAAAVSALVDTAPFPFLLPSPAATTAATADDDERDELRALARNLTPRAGEEASRATALQCCLWAGTLARRAVRLVLGRPDAYRATEVWGGGAVGVGGPRVLAVVNDVRVDPWVEALMRGHAKAVGGGGR